MSISSRAASTFDAPSNRIGLFEYDLSMYGFMKDFIVKLAEAEYSVDVFFKDWDVRPDFTNIRDFDCHDNIRFFDFTTRPTRGQVLRRRIQRLFNRLAIRFAIQLGEKPEHTIDRTILVRSKEILEQSQYLCLIGVEKKGLIWAGLLSEIFESPLLYYSLELYVEDNPDLDKVCHLRSTEKKYHQLSTATIIQDALRGDALLKSNGVENANVIYFPVSVSGGLVRKKSRYLQQKLNISESKKILLYFGSIHPTRCVAPLVKIAGNLDDGLVLVVHGWGPKGYLEYLRSIADMSKVVFSLEFVPEEEIVEMVASAHIGLALYETANVNDRLVAFSSSKMAYYAQCGIPVIAFDTESFRQLIKSHKCGELIRSVDEIPESARHILSNHELYECEAHAAFEQFYNFDKNFARFRSQFEVTLQDAPQ
jgi:glycosyltransferase involved in cell wall biosynthesis